MTSKLKITSGGRQMSLQVKCNICKKKVDPKNTINCLLCKKAYEFDCIGYSEKLHRLKDQETKKTWKCKSCCDKVNKQQTPNSEPSFVTTRKKQSSPLPAPNSLPSPLADDQIPGPSGLNDATVSTPMNLTGLQDSNILTFDDSSYDEALSTSDKLLQRSMDCTVTNTATQAITIAEMKEKIYHIQLELASSQNELDNYILENNDLRSQNVKLTNENNTLKKLCLSPLKENPIMRNTPMKSPAQKRRINTENTPLTLQLQITTLEQKLLASQKEILILTEQIRILEAKLYEGNKPYLQNTQPFPPPPKNKDCRNRILIYGSQQCAGLSSALIRSREHTMYEKYQISGEIKSHALASDILKDCPNINLMPNDKLIVCLGENDYDMNILLIQLRNLFIRFNSNDIVVLNVFKNMYLNVDDLNSKILKLCQEHKKCHFAFCNMTNLPGMCKSANYIIDCIDYDQKYLDVRNLKKLIVRNQTTACRKITKKNDKGTIPYYFAPVSCSSANNPDAKIPLLKIKKTITDYFPIVNRKKGFFRVKKS